MVAIPRKRGMWLFDQDLIPRVGPQLGMLFVTLVWGCLVAGASLLDGTLRLPAPGRGLMEHYGGEGVALLEIGVGMHPA